jgi:hypothetical protein
MAKRDCSVSINAATSPRQRRSESSSAWQRENPASDGGRSASAGIVAPSTSTGTTATPARSASSISRRTKSAGSSSRRAPSPSRTSSQRLPTIASTTVADSTERRIASTKFSPAAISWSRNTRSSPKCASSASASRPVALALSSRR